MKLTCGQVEVLLSFYVNGDLSNSLKNQIEEHLKNCKACKVKYEILTSIIFEFNKECRNKIGINTKNNTFGKTLDNKRYLFFENNLSAYIDNELSNEDNLKIKKIAINNKQARKELETGFQIKKLLSQSFEKTKNEVKNDFTKKILKQIHPKYNRVFYTHSFIKPICFCLFGVFIFILTIILFFII